MDEEIKQKILSYLEGTKDFVLDQAPDVIQQALRYHYLSSLICSLFFTFLFVLCSVVALYNFANPKLTKYDTWEIQTFLFTFIPSMICLLSLICICTNIDTLIKVTTAPKYFLITLFK